MKTGDVIRIGILQSPYKVVWSLTEAQEYHGELENAPNAEPVSGSTELHVGPRSAKKSRHSSVGRANLAKKTARAIGTVGRGPIVSRQDSSVGVARAGV